MEVELQSYFEAETISRSNLYLLLGVLCECWQMNECTSLAIDGFVFLIGIHNLVQTVDTLQRMLRLGVIFA
jgi:hypothetical protein